jgi:thiamine biosynthesis lipoprotein
MKRNSVSQLIIICVISLLLIGITGCLGRDSVESTTLGEPISKQAFKLNTVVTITLYDSRNEDILDGAMAVCDKYEGIYSRTLETSELYKLNHGLLEKSSQGGNNYQVSDDMADILEKGLYYSKLTKGAFDITVEPITSLWNFTASEPVLPEKSDLEDALNRVGYENLHVEDHKVTFDIDGMGIDFGAIAKGYIADRIKEYLLSRGVKSAMINLGGNVLCVGEKPDGTAFKIGIQKPFADRNETVAVMEINDLSVVSSGVYERYFIKDGTLYHHILNPKTGYSYSNNLISVTIISSQSVDGDGLSTSCFALGLEEGLKLINSIKDTYAVFITNDYSLHYSEGFFDHIKVTD